MADESHEKSREVRLGLVMYGGVSLAIYINGVANEFFRAVRGRGVYRLIKALTDSDIVVDVMSGTSAGGINGIMLGYALDNCERLLARQRSAPQSRLDLQRVRHVEIDARRGRTEQAQKLWPNLAEKIE